MPCKGFVMMNDIARLEKWDPMKVLVVLEVVVRLLQKF